MIGGHGLPLPDDFPDRLSLHNELHARPPEALPQRARVSFIAVKDERSAEPVRDLCRRFGHEGPAEDANHFSADMGPFHVKWERHTEYTRFKFIVPAAPRATLFTESALDSVPKDWFETLSGSILVANHIELLPMPKRAPNEERLSKAHFAGNVLVGAELADGLGRAMTDFRIHSDGFGRFVIYDNGMTPRQLGRSVQRLMEVDTYRMLALLSFPVARALMPELERFEQELREITTTMRDADEAQEPELLDRLTLLHADIVRQHTQSHYRFSAANAYAELVSLRLSELRQARIEGLQTFDEFIDRRLAPAMRTCEATAKRLDIISERVSRATQLLSTRVDISRERQNQALLESMDRRAQLQLRLQETVEGLSIAAITYYIVGLVSYLAGGAKALGLLPFSKAVVTAVSIPFVLLFVAWGVRRVRRSISGQEKAGGKTSES